MTTNKSAGGNRIRDALSRIYDGQPPYFREYLRRYKEDPKSRIFAPLAEAYRRMGKVDEAIAICLEGIQFHPEFTGGRVALAKCYIEQQKYNEAKNELERVLDQVPENLLAQRLMGDTYVALDDRESAIHCYKMALLLSPNDANIAQRVEEIEKGLQEQAITETALATEGPDEEEMLEVAEAMQEVEVEEEAVESVMEQAEPIPNEVELVPMVSDAGQIEIVPFSDDKNLSSVDRLLGIEDEEKQEEPFRVEHVSAVFEKEQTDNEITTETLGDLYFSQGQYDRSLRIFEKIREKNPSQEIDKRIRACRMRLGVSQEQAVRDKKIHMLRGILGRLKDKRHEAV